MKKLLSIFLAAAMVLCLAACDYTPPEPLAPELEDMQIGIFYYSYSDAFTEYLRSAVDKSLDQLGVSYTNFDCQNDQSTQNQLIQSAIKAGCNLLIVDIVEAGSASAARDIMTLANGLPVIFLHRPIEGDTDAPGVILNTYTNVGFISTDPIQAGTLQGEMVAAYLMEHYEDTDLNGDGYISYTVLTGNEKDLKSVYRTEHSVSSANAILSAADKNTLRYFNSTSELTYQPDSSGTWSTKAAKDIMIMNLAGYNEANRNMIELIICNNDAMALGVIEVLQSYGYNLGGEAVTIPVFGADAIEEARDQVDAGHMTGTLYENANGMAQALAQTLKALNTGATMLEALAAASRTAENFSISSRVVSVLHVAHVPYPES